MNLVMNMDPDKRDKVAPALVALAASSDKGKDWGFLGRASAHAIGFELNEECARQYLRPGTELFGESG